MKVRLDHWAEARSITLPGHDTRRASHAPLTFAAMCRCSTCTCWRCLPSASLQRLSVRNRGARSTKGRSHVPGSKSLGFLTSYGNAGEESTSSRSLLGEIMPFSLQLILVNSGMASEGPQPSTALRSGSCFREIFALIVKCFGSLHTISAVAVGSC